MVALAPVLAAMALAIAIADGQPVLFRQQRLGLALRPFCFYKFRTMRPPAAATARSGITAAGDPAITPLGRHLRRWRLDELPQLWNIFRGDMSFFGPRPELPQYAALCEVAYRQLLVVRPGLLDAATVKFLHEADLLASAARPEETYRTQILPAKAALSAAYLRRRTWRSDLGLMFTAAVALCRRPSAQPHVQSSARTAR